MVYLRDSTAYIKKLIQQSMVKEEKDRIKQMENLTSTVSHEMRTPLSAVSSFINMLLEEENDEMDRKEVKRILNLIKYQLRMLLCFVNDLLDLR